MKLEAIDYHAENAQQLFVESLRNTGFGVLKNHPIQQQIVRSIYDSWQQFFNSKEKVNSTSMLTLKTVFSPLKFQKQRKEIQ